MICMVPRRKPPCWLRLGARLLAGVLVLAVSGCASLSRDHDWQGNWTEVSKSMQNLLAPDVVGVSSKASEIDQRLRAP